MASAPSGRPLPACVLHRPLGVLLWPLAMQDVVNATGGHFTFQLKALTAAFKQSFEDHLDGPIHRDLRSQTYFWQLCEAGVGGGIIDERRAYLAMDPCLTSATAQGQVSGGTSFRTMCRIWNNTVLCLIGGSVESAAQPHR